MEENHYTFQEPTKQMRKDLPGCGMQRAKASQQRKSKESSAELAVNRFIFTVQQLIF
jgi:hypothetical protein